MKKNLKWLKYSTGVIIFIILSISIFNYKIDRLGLFGNSNYLSNAAKTLTNGNMIAGLENYDERLFQELIIKNLKVKNDAIVIGSSRSMELRKRFFFKEETYFFNHSVSGASLEDYIAIIGAYESIHDYLPNTIIMGIDPWIFNKNNDQNRWQTLNKYYHYELNKITNNKQSNKQNTINIDKWKQLINYDYTVENIKFFKLLLKNKGSTFYVVKTTEIDDSIKETDGSIHYPYKIRNTDYEEVKQAAISYTKGQVYSLNKFDTLSNLTIFEEFIKYLQLKNIDIVFFLSPYNPITYDLLMKETKYQYIDIAEKYLINFAKQQNITVTGSYNPHKYGFTNRDFFDGMHSHEVVAKKIFESTNIKR